MGAFDIPAKLRVLFKERTQTHVDGESGYTTTPLTYLSVGKTLGIEFIRLNLFFCWLFWHARYDTTLGIICQVLFILFFKKRSSK